MKKYLLISILALLSLTAAAASVISYITIVGIDKPVAGAKPDKTAMAAYTNDPNKPNANITVTSVKWSGKFDSNGCFMAGNEYKVTVTATIKSSSDRVYDNNLRKLGGQTCERTKISGTAAVVESVSDKVAVISRRYKLPQAKTAPKEDPNKAAVIDYVSIEGVATPFFGEKPKYGAYTILKKGGRDDRMEVSKFTWSGKLDEFGRFKAGEKYTAKAHIRIKDGVNAVLSPGFRQRIGSSYFSHIIHNTGIIETCTDKEIVIYSTFTTKDLQFHGKGLGRTYYTPQEAGQLQEERSKTLIVNESSVYGNDARLEWVEYVRMVLDIDDEQKTEQYLGIRGLFAAFSLKEIWLSEKYSKEDVLKVINSLERGPWNSDFWGNQKYVGFPWIHTSGYMMTGDSYLVVPEGSVPSGFRAGPYTIRTYKGDVYTALEKGVGQTREWCTNHVFTSQLGTADRVADYVSCDHSNKYYYSCKFCGKCEGNKAHTFVDKRYGGFHDDGQEIIHEKNFLGINYKGERVYWTSCPYCGKNTRDLRMEEYKATYTAEVKSAYQQAGLGYKDYMANMTAAQDRLAKQFLDGKDLNSTGKFVIPKTLNVKLSDSAVNEANWAFLGGFVDEKLLGDDYTKPVTQLQACSMAVLLAEIISDETIKAASSDYLSKAIAAGIVSAGSFRPDAVMTRQEVASYLYRALQYVKSISQIRYTQYESGLSRYADCSALAADFEDAVEFVDALGLMKPTSAKTFSPQSPCTIEDALAAAYRSRHADKIGWYIVRDGMSGNMSVGGAFKLLNQSADVMATLTQYTSRNMFWAHAYHPSDAIEHQGRLEFSDPYTGRRIFVTSKDFHPVRER